MSERQLVTIRTIGSLREIPGADQIETALVDGWTVVVKKGEFAAGDSCLFFEIDSFIPATDTRFAFLEKTKREWRGVPGYRLRTIKLRKQLSQGLALPVAMFVPEIESTDERSLADRLGVLKWEEEEANGTSASRLSTFPSFIPKTDQERIQNVYRDLPVGEMYEVTVKMDGSSITVYRKGEHIGVCSWNQEVQLAEDNNFSCAAQSSGLLFALSRTERNLAIQGELCGPGIQKNRANVANLGIWIFDIYDIDAGKYLLPAERHDLVGGLWQLAAMADAPWELAFQHVPVEAPRTLPTLEGALEMAEKATYISGEPAEGLVFKPMNGGQSFKAISNSYLLTHGL